MHPETEIKNLLFRYAELIDSGEFKAIGLMFEQAAFSSAGNCINGAGAICELYQQTTRLYPCGTPKTQHQVSNIRFLELTSDQAKTSSYFSVSQATDELPLQTIITGNYNDEFAKDSNGKWYFTKREIVPKQIGNLSHHLLFDLDSHK